MQGTPDPNPSAEIWGIGSQKQGTAVSIGAKFGLMSLGYIYNKIFLNICTIKLSIYVIPPLISLLTMFCALSHCQGSPAALAN